MVVVVEVKKRVEGCGEENVRVKSKKKNGRRNVKEDEYKKIMDAETGLDLPIEESNKLSPKIINTLEKGGFETIRDVLEAEIDDLTALPGIGEKTANKIKDALEFNE